MKIYTKTGDKGKTKLVDGTSVNKSDLRVEAYGCVDELNSYLGVVRSQIILLIEDSTDSDFTASDINEWSIFESELEVIQNQLFSVGSLLATGERDVFDQLPQIHFDHNGQLEKWIDHYSAPLPALKNFILPAGHLISSHLHVARTICRRAERRTTEILLAAPHYDHVFIYLNRLSDLLFTWARWANLKTSATETIWKKENV
jgi:cob(I)alamin adenosyltransferase